MPFFVFDIINQQQIIRLFYYALFFYGKPSTHTIRQYLSKGVLDTLYCLSKKSCLFMFREFTMKIWQYISDIQYMTNFCSTNSNIKKFDVKNLYTVCPGSSDPFYIVTYYTYTTSWTHCRKKNSFSSFYGIFSRCISTYSLYTVCPGSSDPFYIVS